ADPFLTEIRIFPFNFAPKCSSSRDRLLLPLTQNTALTSLHGTTYAGNGKSNFALTDQQCRAPMQPGQGPGLSLHDLGETGGSQTVTLLESKIPSHSHALACNDRRGGSGVPVGQQFANAPDGLTYQTVTNANLDSLAPEALAPAGGDEPHNNMQPYLTFYFCIALQGVFPPRS